LQVDKPFDAAEEKIHPYISALHLLKKLGLPVPEYFGAFPSEGWVLLSDLGDQTLQHFNNTENYEEALYLLIRLVTGTEAFQSQKLDAQYEGPHFGWAFDRAKLGQEMEYTAKHLVETRYGMRGQEYLDAVAPTVNYLADRPRFMCHRDYHCRNLMVHGNKLWMIDFQDARMGPLSYDVVSLLWDPYVQIEDSRRLELLEFWKKSLLKTAQALQMSRVLEVFAAAPQSASSFECELERMKVQRLLKAAGSYASFLNLKGRKDYLPSIRPALHSTREALERIVKESKWKCPEDERLLTLVNNYIERESELHS
jgi:aminoglycoside/choline kinase family phosphotransferase